MESQLTTPGRRVRAGARTIRGRKLAVYWSLTCYSSHLVKVVEGSTFCSIASLLHCHVVRLYALMYRVRHMGEENRLCASLVVTILLA